MNWIIVSHHSFLYDNTLTLSICVTSNSMMMSRPNDNAVGTLTTAKITIHAESVWHNPKFSKEDVALYAALASNRDKMEDPIDRSVINHFDRFFGPEGISECSKFIKIRGVGFNPIYKRVVFEFSHSSLGMLLSVLLEHLRTSIESNVVPMRI